MAAGGRSLGVLRAYQSLCHEPGSLPRQVLRRTGSSVPASLRTPPLLPGGARAKGAHRPLTPAASADGARPLRAPRLGGPQPCGLPPPYSPPAGKRTMPPQWKLHVGALQTTLAELPERLQDVSPPPGAQLPAPLRAAVSNDVMLPELPSSGRGKVAPSSAAAAQTMCQQAVAEPDSAPSGPRRLPIGAFQHLPAVSPAREILVSALRRARLLHPAKSIVSAAKRERSKGARQLDALTKELSGPLGTYVRGFPRRQRLHPYEQAVLELSLGEGVYEEVLGAVDCLRKRVLDVGKSCAALVNKTTSKAEAVAQTEKGFEHLEELFAKRSHVVDRLKEMAKLLRRLPVVRHDIPTLCLVGAPNVGKSSLVRAISSGKPEVCNYPFTTRGISMGHFFVGTRRHQVTDTPGLLARPDKERNNIELLTIAALKYLPTSVLFVHDLTEECGTSVEDQYKLYVEMKERFGEKPWIDVVSKADLRHSHLSSRGTGAGGHEQVSLDEYRLHGPAGAAQVSTETEQGLEGLRQRVTTLLAQVESAEDGDLVDGEEKQEKLEDAWAGQLAIPEKGGKEDFYYPTYHAAL